ncbi:MAG: radical SAM protein [Spirochaetia bacterium]|nr:radical SAM protein [Spirochaetia bacterium]
MIAEKCIKNEIFTELTPTFKDPFGRTFKKLRLSVLPSCNFNCIYCDPGASPSHLSGMSHSLSLEKLLGTVQKIHEQTNLTSVRITGGEPLLYKNLPELIFQLKSMKISSVKITTNASRLYERLPELKEAGIDGFNISLDAVDSSVFLKMSGQKGNLKQILKAVDECIRLEIPIKLNATLVRGCNENQVLPLLEFAMSRNISIRYIELMDMGPLFGKTKERLFPEKEILESIQKSYTLTSLRREKNSTARYFRVNGSSYVFGIISNSSSPFCQDCDRLRLSSEGMIFGCLSENRGFSVRNLKSSEEWGDVLTKALKQKKSDSFSGSSLSMKNIGG